MKKILLVFLTILAAPWIWYGESRNFYCLNNERCVTVWKTYGNVAYIIPGKYYGPFKPSGRAYVKSTNTNSIDIIWPNGVDTIIVASNEDAIDIQQSSVGPTIVEYRSNKERYDSLYSKKEGHYSIYSEKVQMIYIDIHDNYATDREGRKL